MYRLQGYMQLFTKHLMIGVEVIAFKSTFSPPLEVSPSGFQKTILVRYNDEARELYSQL